MDLFHDQLPKASVAPHGPLSVVPVGPAPVALPMSQTRTGHKPEDWRDDGPSVVIRHGNGIEAEPIGSMRPILVHGQTMTDARRGSAKRASRRYRARVG